MSSSVLLIAFDVWLAAGLGVALGGALGAFIIARIARISVASARREATQILATAKAEGEAANIEGTPTIYVNGRKFEEPLKALPAYIAEEKDL